MAPGILRLPAVLVTPSYRLAPQFRFPAALDDLVAALNWVRANIAQFGGAPQRIVVGGHSAGGHLAALSTLARPEAAAGIVGCMPVSASFDLRYPDAKPGSGEERVYRYLLERPSDDAAASPIRFVHSASVPFAIAIGEHDFPRVDRTSRDFCAALSAAGTTCRLAVWPDCDHFGVHLALRDPTHAWYAELGMLLNQKCAPGTWAPRQ
jgi:acetyl esterase/lipase